MEEIAKFSRLLKENIYEQQEDKISSSGYVVDRLEASIWCSLSTDNFNDAFLKAVTWVKIQIDRCSHWWACWFALKEICIFKL